MSDYISRETAIVDFERCNHETPVWTPQRVKTLLMRIQTADVAPVRHGRWERTRWIPCSERLPELQDTRWVRTVIVCARGHVMPMIYERDIVQGKAVGVWKWMWRGIFKEPEAITHWMPIPEPPKEGDGK